MKYDPQKHHRRSIRLRGYDYSQSGAYFVTICTYKREMLLGNIVDGKMVLNEFGRIVEKCWLEIPNHYPNACLDKFKVMPNHIHGIIFIFSDDEIGQSVGAKNFSPLQLNQHPNNPIKFRSPSKTIGSIIRGFKIGVTKWFRINTNIYPIWQRNYHDHIIRDEPDLNRIRKYIVENPLKWQDDKYYLN